MKCATNNKIIHSVSALQVFRAVYKSQCPAKQFLVCLRDGKKTPKNPKLNKESVALGR